MASIRKSFILLALMQIGGLAYAASTSTILFKGKTQLGQCDQSHGIRKLFVVTQTAPLFANENQHSPQLGKLEVGDVFAGEVSENGWVKISHLGAIAHIAYGQVQCLYSE